MEKRKTIQQKMQLMVWIRDGWTCRYCGKEVFFAPTLKLLEELSPHHGYYDAHGNERKMISLFAHRWASVDHDIPHSKGGEDSLNNYITACWRCNNTMKDKTYEQGKPIPRKIDEVKQKPGWDGMSSLYLVLNEKQDVWTKLLKELL